jgi:hypothetical protein
MQRSKLCTAIGMGDVYQKECDVRLLSTHHTINRLISLKLYRCRSESRLILLTYCELASI